MSIFGTEIFKKRGMSDNLLKVGEVAPTLKQLHSASSALPARYTTSLDIPQEFPLILKEFTREILREQPANIYEFGVTYFKKKVEERSNQEHKK